MLEVQVLRAGEQMHPAGDLSEGKTVVTLDLEAEVRLARLGCGWKGF